MHRSTIPAALVGSIALTPIVQFTAMAAKTPVEIGEIAQAISVKIQSTDSIGTGVIVRKQGRVYTVLTAAHTIDDRTVKYKVSTADGQEYAPKANSIRYSPNDIDLAVFQFESDKQYRVAKFGDSSKLKIGMSSYVGGFPAPTVVITESVFTFRRGEISANSSKSFAKGYSILYSNDTLPGMSGGPVLNDVGEVVGIHGRGDRDTATGAKTNFNAGIPIAQAAILTQGTDIERIARLPQNKAPKADDFYVSAYQKYEQKNFAGAMQDYDRAIAMSPKYAEAWNNRGHLKAEIKDYKGSLSDYNTAISANPKLARAYYNRAVLKSQMEDVSGALSDYNSAIAIDPNYARAYNNRGIVLQARNNLKGATKDFNTAIKLDPNYAAAYYNRAGVKELQNDTTSVVDLDRAIALDPNYAEAYNNRAIFYQKNGNIKAALQDFDRAIVLNPKYVEAYSNRGAIKYEQLSDIKGALADFDRAIAIDPQQTIAYCNRGLVREDLGNSDAAMSDFKKAAAGKNTNAIDVVFSKAAIALKQGKMDAALQGFQRAIELNQEYADAYLYQGLTKKHLGDRSNAIISLRTAVDLYKTQGQKRSHSKAVKHLQELEKTTSKSPSTQSDKPTRSPQPATPPSDLSF
jgi:tetratricopeptide (TPR) repeat protein/V8-like Glu-specific endopeptidase